MNQQEQLRNPADELREEMLAQSSEQIHAIANSLASTRPREQEKTRLYEPIFRDVFLPMFLNQRNERYPHITGGNWVTVAGSPYMEVDVIDQAGKVLFTVPPFMENGMVQPATGQADTDMSFVVKQAQLYENTLPMVAERYLSEELTKRLDIMKSNVDTSKMADAWFKILAHYNIKVQSTAPGKTPESTDPTDDYEEIAP